MINKLVIESCELHWAYARKPREINIHPFISSIEFAHNDAGRDEEWTAFIMTVKSINYLYHV